MAKHVVLERLNQLVAKGYIVRWGGSEQDTLRLEHPRAPDLTFRRPDMDSDPASRRLDCRRKWNRSAAVPIFRFSKRLDRH